MLGKTAQATLYCRVASSDGFALEAQRVSLSCFAKELGSDGCVEYLDNGASGLTLDRPAFSRLEADILAGRVHTVLIRDISRVSRNPVAFYRWLRDAYGRGVTVISQSDGVINPEDTVFGTMVGLYGAPV